MSLRITAATVRRILAQLGHDRRTVGVITVAPIVVVTLLHHLFGGAEPMVSKLELEMLIVFPIIIMFLLTAIAMVRERISGSLERLLTTPIAKADILLAYALAFGLLATIQVLVLAGYCFWVLGMTVAGPTWAVVLAGVLGAQLGVVFGLLASALSRSEFQAIQFFPTLIIPQLILCGLFGPRTEQPDWLYALSSALPISYAVGAIEELFSNAEPTTTYWQYTGITLACVVGLLVLAAATLRRRTP